MWTFSVERRREVAVVFLHGELDMSCSSDAGSLLRAELGRDGTDRLIADLGDLRFLDAATVNELIRVHLVARDAGRSFAVRRLRPLVFQILHTTGTLDLLSSDTRAHLN